MGFFDEQVGAGKLDVIALLDSKAGTAVAEAVQAGALVSLALTSDGGALGVTVTVDSQPVRQYFRNEDELALWLTTGMPDIVEAVDAARERRASRGSRGRLRGA